MKTYHFTITKESAGRRIDQFIAEETGLTRAEVQKWVKSGNCSLASGKAVKLSYRLAAGDIVDFSYEEPQETALVPEDIPLDILYEDEYMIVLNKARGMVIHPGSGNPNGTLANALLFHVGPSILSVGDPARPGIVHRLDKDTSGVMVAAKTPEAAEKLSKEIGSHEAVRKYVTLVHGQMEGDHGIIRLPLGRSLKDRMKWDVEPKTGKPAVTHFRVLESMPHYSYLECRLETGRTHQIRVHMAHIRHPVVNDPLYGWKKDHFPIEGQALHSHTLDIHHPITGELMHFEAPIPEEFLACLALARKADTL